MFQKTICSVLAFQIAVWNVNLTAFAVDIDSSHSALAENHPEVVPASQLEEISAHAEGDPLSPDSLNQIQITSRLRAAQAPYKTYSRQDVIETYRYLYSKLRQNQSGLSAEFLAEPEDLELQAIDIESNLQQDQRPYQLLSAFEAEIQAIEENQDWSPDTIGPILEAIRAWVDAEGSEVQNTTLQTCPVLNDLKESLTPIKFTKKEIYTTLGIAGVSIIIGVILLACEAPVVLPMALTGHYRCPADYLPIHLFCSGKQNRPIYRGNGYACNDGILYTDPRRVLYCENPQTHEIISTHLVPNVNRQTTKTVGLSIGGAASFFLLEFPAGFCCAVVGGKILTKIRQRSNAEKALTQTLKAVDPESLFSSLPRIINELVLGKRGG